MLLRGREGLWHRVGGITRPAGSLQEPLGEVLEVNLRKQLIEDLDAPQTTLYYIVTSRSNDYLLLICVHAKIPASNYTLSELVSTRGGTSSRRKVHAIFTIQPRESRTLRSHILVNKAS